jgi:sugar phosphate isomerase/epimerase
MTLPLLGLQLYTVRHADLPLGDLLHEVAAAGYAGVETVGTQGVAPAELRDALDGAGLALASAHVPLADLRRDPDAVADVHLTLGTPMLVVPWLAPEDRPGDLPGWTALGRELDALGERLGAAGLRLAYHHHDFELERHGDRDGLTALLDAAAPERLSVELDAGWLAAVGDDPVARLAAWGPRVARLHLKDLDPRHTPPWTDVGDGTLDVAAVLEAAAAHGVAWVLVEHDAPTDPLATARRSAAAAGRILRALATRG